MGSINFGPTPDPGYKYINRPEDFPPPVNGVISLENKIYDLKLNTITISDILAFPEGLDCKIQNGTIIYTGSNSLFTTVEMGDRVKRLSDVSIDFTGGGSLFDLTGTVPRGTVVIDNMLVENAVSLGTFNGIGYTINTVRFLDFGTGFTFTDMTFANFNSIFMIGINQSTKFFNFTGTANGPILFVNVAPFVNTNEILFDFNSGTNFIGVTCSVSPVTFLGAATQEFNIFAPGSYNQKTIGFNFEGNVGIQSSTVSARIGFQNNSIETVIDEKLVPVRVKGIYTDGFEERTTYTEDGVITHTGTETITANVTATISLEPVTGINIIMGCYVAHIEVDTYGVTYTNGTNIINRAGHALLDDMSIRLTSDGTLPAEIREDQFYWVVNATTNTFQISRTKGGAVHTFTDDGTGTHYYALGEYIEYSEVTDATSTNSPGNISIKAKILWKPGAKIQVMTDNHDTTSNILATSINVLIGKG